jgi:hypothetical protein
VITNNGIDKGAVSGNTQQVVEENKGDSSEVREEITGQRNEDENAVVWVRIKLTEESKRKKNEHKE